MVRSFWSFRPECPFSFDKNFFVVPSSAHLYNASLTSTHTIFKCVVAWIRTAQLEYTPPFGHVEFLKFQTGLFLEWKVPRISASEVI